MESEWHWQPVDRSFSLPIIPAGGIKELTSKFDLCVTGEVANVILNAFVYNACGLKVCSLFLCFATHYHFAVFFYEEVVFVV